MHSIGHFILERNPDAKIICVTSEEFTNEVIESIRSGNAAAMNKFREKYRTIDVLMIDDVQFIIGRKNFSIRSMPSTPPANRLFLPPISRRKRWRHWKNVSVPVSSGV